MKQKPLKPQRKYEEQIKTCKEIGRITYCYTYDMIPDECPRTCSYAQERAKLGKLEKLG